MTVNLLGDTEARVSVQPRWRAIEFQDDGWCLSLLPQFLPQAEIQLHSSFLAGTVLPLATVSGLGCTRTESTDWGLRLACFVMLFSHGEVLSAVFLACHSVLPKTSYKYP